MYNKFDTTSPLAEQSVPDMLNSQPIMASVLPEIVEGQTLLKLNIPILEIFKKRMDNWIPTSSALENAYPLDQLFNQYLTVDDLKNSIRNLKDLVEILSHSKISMHNRYILLNAFIAVFPASTQPNAVPEPFSDEKFLASLIHDANDLRHLLNTIFPLQPHKLLAIKFLQWAELNSPYLKGILESANVRLYREPVFMQMPPQPIYINTQMNPLPQQVRSVPLYQNPYPIQNNTTIIEMFTKRIEQTDTKSLKSFKYYQEILFDKNLTVAQLKDSIQTLDDLLKIFEQHLICHHKACYSLFNYLISVFPVPENNGNLSGHPCDESFIKKIIKDQEDIKKVSDFFGSCPSVNFSKILEHRLLKRSPHCRSILQPQPQPNFNHSPSFFLPNIQSITHPEHIPMDLVDSVEQNVTSKQSILSKTTDDISSGSEHWEADSINKRPLKRLKENPITSVETLARQQVPSQHSVGILASFFSPKSTPQRVIQEPEGGEIIYVIDQSGKMSAVDEATGLAIL